MLRLTRAREIACELYEVSEEHLGRRFVAPRAGQDHVALDVGAERRSERILVAIQPRVNRDAGLEGLLAQVGPFGDLDLFLLLPVDERDLRHGNRFLLRDRQAPGPLIHGLTMRGAL